MMNSRLLAATIGTGLMASFAVWGYKDYQDYLALGPGGLPYNLVGWAAVAFIIRPFALSKSEATSVSDYPDAGAHESIEQLPVRKGDRALLRGVVPHRQLSQHAPEAMRQYVTNLFLNAALQHPELLEIKQSLYERHHDALFVSSNLLESDESGIPETARTSRGEIGHVHTDLSVHLYLQPADARQIIEKAWAERHRLSVPKSPWPRIRFGIADTYLMIYGPRNEEELEVLRVILENSIRFMTGTEKVERIAWKAAF